MLHGRYKDVSTRDITISERLYIYTYKERESGRENGTKTEVGKNIDKRIYNTQLFMSMNVDR